jgi:deazaflavin-dependent oxidoreductase (nitroreductase family)
MRSSGREGDLSTGPSGSPPAGLPARPLLGLRRQPGRLALGLFRLPLHAYRHGAGWMLGRTFLALTHTGRRTGRRYEAVAMVLRHDEVTSESVVCSAWGARADWWQNLRAGPAVTVRLGRSSYTPRHRFLTDDEAYDVVVHFRRRHPHRLRLICRILGWGDLRDDAAALAFVRTHPFVAFRPDTGPGDV